MAVEWGRRRRRRWVVVDEEEKVEVEVPNKIPDYFGTHSNEAGYGALFFRVAST